MGRSLDGGAAVPTGPTCRLCERSDRSQRVLPPLCHSAVVADGAAIR